MPKEYRNQIKKFEEITSEPSGKYIRNIDAKSRRFRTHKTGFFMGGNETGQRIEVFEDSSGIALNFYDSNNDLNATIKSDQGGLLLTIGVSPNNKNYRFSGDNSSFLLGGGLQLSTSSFSDGDTTPSIKGNTIWATNNTGATTITSFDDMLSGNIFIIRFDDANTTIQDGASIQLSGGVDFTGAVNDTITFIRGSSGSVALEVSRSVN